MLRRAPHLKAIFGAESADAETLDWQFSRVASLETAFREFMKEAPAKLLARVRTARGTELVDILHALGDLRVDAAAELLPLVQRSVCEERALMIDVLQWSRESCVAGWLRDYARDKVAMVKRSQARRQVDVPRRPSISGHVPYRNILHSLCAGIPRSRRNGS